MQTLIYFLLAALGELLGCYAFWTWLRLGKGMIWTIPGTLALILFAIALTKVDVSHAGRAYAAYGGIYILASISWLWIVDQVKPDRWDLLGVAIAIVGTLVIMLSPHRS